MTDSQSYRVTTRFTLECGRLQLGQAKRELRSMAHQLGLDIDLDEAKTWLAGCSVFATVRGAEPAVTVYLRCVDRWIEANNEAVDVER